MRRRKLKEGGDTAALFMGVLNLLARSEGIQPNLETIRGLLDLLDSGNQQPQPDASFVNGSQIKEKTDAKDSRGCAL